MKRKQKFIADSEPWLSGSIRRKLTLFVIIMSFTLVGLFWFFSVFLLQPAYNRIIRVDITSALNQTLKILNKAEADGLPMVNEYLMPDGTVRPMLSPECVALLDTALADGTLRLEGRCLDVADANGTNILLYDTIAPRCLLHLSHESRISTSEIQLTPEYDGTLVTRMRAQVRTEGSYYEIVEGVAENSTAGAHKGGQMVMGKTTNGGGYTVIVSANLERIPQAVEVLNKLLIPIAGVLIVLSVSAAWGFSHWFTRPVNRLSAAAKEMAKGNYDVYVDDTGDDEIAALAGDFNTMAREVKRSAELQKDLIANISHDLRTPLTLIKGYAETVRDLTGDEPAKRTQQLSVIIDETDRLSALVNSVLELSRMSSGNEKPNPVRFDLYQLAEEVGERYDAMCVQKGYTFDFAGEEGSFVTADPALIERVLHNLLGNALQHVGEDGYIGLHVLKKPEEGRVRVQVLDHGPGIAEEDQPYLFDRYYRSRSDAGKPGTGLGLSITKAILEAHGFTYGVQSRPGEGATFWFEAPLEAKPKGEE